MTMINKYLLFIIAFKSITKAAEHNGNLCPQIFERIIMIDDELIKYNTTIYKCCDGYRKPFETSNTCEPICDPACAHFSRCTKPQTCECYEKNPLTDKCEPYCDDILFRPDFAINQCVLKNCSCPSGGGYCLNDYNACICYEGFRRTYDNICEPECQHHCENADCIGPNQCECWPDYHATANPNVCEPNDLCQRQLCENGECLLTGECKCKRGFTKSFNFKGQIICQTIPDVITKIMSLILGIPLLLAFIVLLVVYIVARKKNIKDLDKHCELYDTGCDGSKVIYATGNQVQSSRGIYNYDNDVSL